MDYTVHLGDSVARHHHRRRMRIRTSPPSTGIGHDDGRGE